MDKLEKVEKLRERANVTYEQAKKALEDSEWDMLDALVKLETQGKVKDEPTAEFSTKIDLVQTKQDHGQKTSYEPRPEGFLTRLGKGICSLVRKGCENRLIATRHGEQIIELPVIALLIFLILFFWVIVPLMVVGLFFDYRYSFKGPELGKQSVNNAMDQASKVANDIKADVTGNNDKK